MLVTILALIAATFSFNYKRGQAFSYNYHTSVDTTTGKDTESAHTTTLTVDVNATFTVLNSVSDGAYLALTLSNLKIEVIDEETQTYGPEAALDEVFGEPLYFKFRKNGTITDVISSKKDTKELTNIKVAIAYALRTNLQASLEADYETATVIDPMGKHTEYTTVGRRGNSITVDTYYSDSDFVGFADHGVSEGEISVDSQSTHVIDGDRVTSVYSATTVILSKPATEQRSNDDEETEDVPITITGISTLSDYTEMDGEVAENSEIVSVAKFLSQNKGYGFVPTLRDSFYVRSPFTSLEKVVAGASTSSCPSACNLCKSTSGSYTGGNNNAGFKASASAVVGVEKGCKSAKRSYIVGAYATLNIILIGKTINAVDAYAEYGQLNGSAQRNAVHLSLFGYQLYHKALTGLDCRSKTINVFNSNKSASYTYSIPVYCVTIQLTASIKFNLKADVIFQICVNQFTASVTFKPSATVTLSGKASASVGIAKASAEVTGTITDYLDPKAYVDGNLCRVGFSAYNHLSSITVKLEAYFEILDWKKLWSKDEKYKSGKKWNIWSASFGGRNDKLVDIYWS